jgi:hypothetical protein
MFRIAAGSRNRAKARLGAAALIATFLAASGQATARSAVSWLVEGSKPKIKPERVSLPVINGPFGKQLNRWQRWDASRTVASGGTMYYDTCRPSCAGGYKTDSGRVVLTRIRGCAGRRHYTKAFFYYDHHPRYDAYGRVDCRGRIKVGGFLHRGGGPKLASAASTCGNVRAHYRERGTRQYVEASSIRARHVGCSRARRIARSWASKVPDYGFNPSLVHHAAGFRCRFKRIGSDVGETHCRKGIKRVGFGEYDSSPYH